MASTSSCCSDAPRLNRIPCQKKQVFQQYMPRPLELFSGTGSIGRAFDSLGWGVAAFDNDPRARATHHCDINDFDWRCVGKVDVVWASPPCTNHSRAHSRGGARDLETSDSLVRKTLEIAEALGGPPCCIENPHSGQLKNRDLLSHLDMRVLDYCKYPPPHSVVLRGPSSRSGSCSESRQSYATRSLISATQP